MLFLFSILAVRFVYQPHELVTRPDYPPVEILRDVVGGVVATEEPSVEILGDGVAAAVGLDGSDDPPVKVLDRFLVHSPSLL